MARTISEQEVTETITVSNRTWRVEVFCELNQSYQIVFHREQTKKIGNEPAVVIQKLPTIKKSLQEVMTKEITVGDDTLTIAQIAAFVAATADTLEAEEESEE